MPESKEVLFASLPDGSIIEQARHALFQNGFDVVIVGSGEEAKKKVLEMLPQGAEVQNNTSITLEQIGVAEEIVESGRYNSVRKQLLSMENERDKRKLAAAPDWVVGSAHAITRSGEILVVSNTGSQLGPLPYTAGKVILVVGAQKIVTDLSSGLRRVSEYILPLESERLSRRLGRTIQSGVSKTLTLNRELVPGRTTVILVKEILGF